MDFQIETIIRNDTDSDQPFSLEMIVVSNEDWEPHTGKEKIFILDIAAKHLQTFPAFQEIVANTFGLWLSDPAGKGTPFDRRPGMEWDDRVSEAFEAGRRLQEDTGGPTPQKPGGDISDIRTAAATDQNTKRFLAFIKNGLAIYETGLFAGDNEFSGNEIDSLAKRVKLIFEAAEEDRFHKSFAEAEHERALEVKNAAKARQLLAEINELPEELSLAIMESLEGKHANTH